MSPSLSPSFFKQLLELAVKNVLFLFNGKLFSQFDGVGMGNPLGPTLANVFLCFHEQRWLDDCPIEFKPKLYRSYVDDIFLLFSDQSHVNQFYNYINSKHSNIKFTSDIEKNNCLNFLDVDINRINNCFSTKVYRKKTFTGLGLRFDSFIPSFYKVNLITCLVHRAYAICSNYIDFDVELSHLRNFFSGNRYPQYLFDKFVSKYLNSIHTPPKRKLTVPKFDIFVPLPYSGDISLNCKKELNSLLNKFYPQIKLNFLFKNKTTIGSFFPYKDKIPPLLSSGLIYKYSCGQCQSTYIGETMMQLSLIHI